MPGYLGCMEVPSGDGFASVPWMSDRLKAVLFDVDGTLIDSNDAHAAAWVKAFSEFGVNVDPILVRRSIGMGGDQLMPAVSGIEETSSIGARVALRRGQLFTKEFLPSLKPFPGAHDLVSAIGSLGFTVVAASSASKDDLTALLRIADATSLMDSWTSSDDADQSKPAPDIIHAALQRANASPEDAVMIGDTPYDVMAARRAGVRVIGFRSGGWLDPDLVGTIEIYDGPWHLLDRLGDSVLAG